jgi:hypothetical protein
MAGWTNKGKLRMLGGWFRAESIPTNFYLALYTSATAPTADTDTHSQLTQIATGNGYTTGGYQLARNSTDFDVLTEDDPNDRALVQCKDIVWTAAGGPIPASGNGARYACLTDDNGTESARHVLHYFDLSSDRTISSGQTLTLQNVEVRINES